MESNHIVRTAEQITRSFSNLTREQRDAIALYVFGNYQRGFKFTDKERMKFQMDQICLYNEVHHTGAQRQLTYPSVPSDLSTPNTFGCEDFEKVCQDLNNNSNPVGKHTFTTPNSSPTTERTSTTVMQTPETGHSWKSKDNHKYTTPRKSFTPHQ